MAELRTTFSNNVLDATKAFALTLTAPADVEGLPTSLRQIAAQAAREAGADQEIVVAPEFLRQYSMSGDADDRSKYQIGVLREDLGRGGSKLLHRIFSKGRKIFISKPINHFPLVKDATKSFLMGGGIGITPMIAMAHELHAAGADFLQVK